MKRPIPIGVSDFRALREQGMEYVDKSQLVCEVLDKGAQTLLLPRPRRFGKTLNLSMLRCFFEKGGEDVSTLFADLAVWRAGDAYRRHFRRYPVVLITFKDVKAATWEHAWDGIRKKIEVLFREHAYLLDGGHLDEWEIRDFRAVVDATAGPTLYDRALLDLSGYLHRHHGERVVVLIDEYDQPIHAGYAGGYTGEAVAFFRAFLNAGLKDNPHLFKGVLTGILRIAKESIFSGLNNLGVYSLLDRDFSTSFGFTEPEVRALLDNAGLGAHADAVRSWYDGYVFGRTVIYNPWSILNFIDRGDARPRGYWTTTSSNDLVRDMLVRHGLAVQPALEALLEGDSIVQRLDEGVALTDLAPRPDALFSLLVFSGYLQATETEGPPGEEPCYRLSIPNREVGLVYTTTFREWMQARLGGTKRDVERLTKALLSGDAEALEEQLQAFTQNLLSYHDTALRPEQVYHAFVIGLLATLEPEYLVRSNRESGQGRPDVTVRPARPGKPGAVLELKVAKPGKKTAEKALEEGLAQIRANSYAAELSAAGATPVYAFAVAFDGKTVRVLGGGDTAEPPADRAKA